MEQYISKSDLVAEIKRRRDYYKRNPLLVNAKYCIDEDNAILKLLDTLEVKEGDLEKDMQDALRTEYEKGRHDVIEKTLKWLWDLNQEHEIMSYTDSHVLSSDELQKYYKNNIEE